ncbi:pyridoxal phosphate-dependent aminotransferase [candidate division KSB1 bacterium]|nr:pyridoxal phosphate-dependent aminotransferase [candidate division KSB1 bacterium]
MHFVESEFAKRVNPSETLAVTTLIAELRRQGKNVIDLGAGEPDFETPEHIKAAGIRAIETGKTKYTPNVGTLSLREAICRKLYSDFGAQYEPKQVVVSNGAKQSIHNTVLALCNPGDEVIIPSPYWVSYPEQVKMAEAVPRFLPGEEANDFKIKPEALAREVNASTKLILLNNPSNPTGTVYTKQELQALIEVLRKHEVWILADEIYLKLVYRGSATASLATFPEIRDRLLLVNGFSKSYAMTGWRLGYVVAPPPVANAVAKIQSHTTSNPCSISQEAGFAALEGSEEALMAMRTQFEARRDFVHAAVSQWPGVSARLPGGAFYVFCNVAQVLGRKYRDKTISSPSVLCQLLVEHAGVALVGGEAFGSTRHVRISYANSMENLREAMHRLQRAFEEIAAV